MIKVFFLSGNIHFNPKLKMIWWVILLLTICQMSLAQPLKAQGIDIASGLRSSGVDCVNLDKLSGPHRMAKLYECHYFGKSASNAEVRLLRESGNYSGQSAIRNLHDQLRHHVVMFEGCNPEIMDVNDTTYHAMLQTVVPGSIDSRTRRQNFYRGTATFIGPSCRVLITAAHNFLSLYG